MRVRRILLQADTDPAFARGPENMITLRLHRMNGNYVATDEVFLDDRMAQYVDYL